MNAQQRLEIEQACTRLAVDYAYHIDRREMEPWSQLFLEDAEFVLMGQSHKGRAAILAGLGAGGGDFVTFHSNSNYRIDAVSDSEATGTIGVTVFAAPGKGTAVVKEIAPFMVGYYDDRYRKTASGWKFERREFVATFTRPAG